VVAGGTEGLDLAEGLEVYLAQHRQACQLGLAGLLRIHPRVGVRKFMIHRQEEPALPSMDITPAVARALFGGEPLQPGQEGAPVRLLSPLQLKEVESAGNVVGVLGQGPVGGILCAHYDHLGALPDGRFFPGAADNASGVSLVLEAARLLAGCWSSFPFSLLFLLTSAEEVGLVGARRFLQRFSGELLPFAAVINVDEIAGDPSVPLTMLCAPQMTESLLSADDVPLLGASLQKGPLALPGFADYVPFLEAGRERVVGLLSYDPASTVNHTLEDSPQLLSAQRLEAGARALLLLTLRLALHTLLYLRS